MVHPINFPQESEVVPDSSGQPLEDHDILGEAVAPVPKAGREEGTADPGV